MKTFTRLSMFLTLAFAWMMQANAQNTCDAPGAMDCGQTFFGSTTGVANDNATAGAGTCNGLTVGTGGQQWYALTLPENGNVNISMDTPNTDYDSKLHVYEGGCGALACVTADDDGGVVAGLSSVVNFDAVGGTTYLILLAY
jgi:hypothetical protein